MKLNFDDLDLFKESIKEWGLEFIQLDRGALVGSVKVARSDRLLLVNTTLNRTFHQQGLSPDLGLTFAVLATSCLEMSYLGWKILPSTIAVLPLDRAFEAYSECDFSIHVITLQQELLEFVAEIHELNDVLDGLPPRGDVYMCRPTDVAALRWAFEDTHTAVQQTPILDSAREFELAHLVLWALARRTGHQRPPRSRKRDLAFKAGIELIMERHSDELTIPELATAVGASERTLRYAFEEKVGVSPKTFLLHVRLRRVQSALIKADPAKTTVQEIALQFGFGHMGEFSQYYRRMFDELPSQTLRKCR